ncbi:hypothetical protein RRG08_048052 [Elysia crispata]|uniref:Uncharacterized protein n=1 Tax=Elysia crispata TaxID=231223 RepID=A0AAE0Z2N2_9GAST|nr:hypothetical protein RRG08_048052 [Elysia crispata]
MFISCDERVVAAILINEGPSGHWSTVHGQQAGEGAPCNSRLIYRIKMGRMAMVKSLWGLSETRPVNTGGQARGECLTWYILRHVIAECLT